MITYTSPLVGPEGWVSLRGKVMSDCLGYPMGRLTYISTTSSQSKQAN